MNDFDKKLDFDSNTFENMKHDMNFVLQRLLGNMIEKQSNEGSMTIKIDVTMVKEFIPNYDPNIKGESREISKPQFNAHRIAQECSVLVSYPKMRIEGTAVNLGDVHIMLPDCRIISIEELKKIEGGVK